MLRRRPSHLLVPDARRSASRFSSGPTSSLLFTRSDTLRAADDPEAFWGEASKRISFYQPFHSIVPAMLPINPVGDITAPPPVPLSTGQWFTGGSLNICYNAVDRHAAANPSKVAFYYDSPVTNVAYPITYGELLTQVSAVASVLHSDFHVNKGDTVIIYMPNTPEAVYTMLACARLGAVHSVVFGGFAPMELSKRILDTRTAVVITSSCGIDGKKVLNYKTLVDKAIELLPDPMQVKHVGIWLRKEVPTVDMKVWRDVSMNERMRHRLSTPLASCPACVPVPSDHPFYILYTSGTTGTPKGIVRDTAGTAVMLALQTEKVFGIPREDGVLFTASDIGWIVGTNFAVYGPLLHGCTSVLYEGKPVGTPDAAAFFRVIEQYRATALSTAPTALRAIKGADPEGLGAKRHDLSSLQRVYLAGERTDPTSVHWTEELLQVPVIDNWWQTETGSPITSAPYDPTTNSITYVAGSCGIACTGWQVEVHATDAVHDGDEGSGLSGELRIKLPLPPGALHSIWGRPTAVRDTYLTQVPGYFSTFDAGVITEDGFVSVMARTDDVINVAGHRLSTGQMEAVLCEHNAVAEAAVVSAKCDLRGEKPLGIVVLKQGALVDVSTLQTLVRSVVGPIAIIDVVIVNALPKTRSGKVLRRTIRSIAAKDSSLQVPPTIEDASVIPDIWERIHKEPMPTTMSLLDVALEFIPLS